jgi:hypothetical protein
MVRLVGVMARCQGQRKSSEFRRYLVLARVDSGAVGEVEVGARAGGERGLDAADGLDNGAELERADARGRQQRREDHVIPRRDADDVVGARVHVLEEPARGPPGSEHHQPGLLVGLGRPEAWHVEAQRAVRGLGSRHRRGAGLQPRHRRGDASAQKPGARTPVGEPRDREAVERRHVRTRRDAAVQRAARITQRGRCPRRGAGLGGDPRQGLRQLRAAPPDP